MLRPLLLPALALSLVACTEEATGPEEATAAGRYAVVDTVEGSWSVSAKDGLYAGFAVTITKDSLIWEKAPIKTLRPTADGRRFYAYGGRMGLTDGHSASDSVLFEYFKKGDTLWVEYQMTSKGADGKLDRGSWLSHALLPRK